jgi:class 3 adenylate cyclase
MPARANDSARGRIGRCGFSAVVGQCADIRAGHINGGVVAEYFERTYRIDPQAADEGRELAVLSADVVVAATTDQLPDGGADPDPSIAELLDALTRVGSTKGKVIERGDGHLTCVFGSAQDAAQAAEEMQSKFSAESRLRAKIGFDLGPVVEQDGEYQGDAVNTAARVAEKTNAGWIITTRAVYDRLSIEYQMKLDSLDFVALKGGRAPIELFRMFAGTDYLRPRSDGDTWSPYERVTLRHGANEYVVGRGDKSLEIGRDSSKGLVLDDRAVSMHHARIEYRNGEFMVVDTSTNGTFIAFDVEPHFKIPRELKLRRPGTLWFGRSPNDPDALSAQYDLE